MKRIGMEILWVASVPVAVCGVAYAVGCSLDAEDSAKTLVVVHGACDTDDNPCTVEDCSNPSAAPKVLSDGTMIPNLKARECHFWVCKNGSPEEEPASVDDECARASGSGYCSAALKCVECTKNDQCSNGFCHGNVCVPCVDGGALCEGAVCAKCVRNECDGSTDCASGVCMGRCGSNDCKIGDPCGAKKCGDLTCRSTKGTACEVDTDCASGLCQNGVCF
jgi:hypothetical protein